jgi:ABC-2 type transport system ATP-binding protein
MTLLVSTPYMDEAELCTRVAFISDGKIRLVSSPTDLKNSFSYPVLEIHLQKRHPLRLHDLPGILDVSLMGSKVRVIVRDREQAVMQLNNTSFASICRSNHSGSLACHGGHLRGMGGRGSGTMEYAISTRNLTRCFGDFVAVDNLTMDIIPGEICGFLGPNGAGKSTAIRMLCGILAPSSGAEPCLAMTCCRKRKKSNRKSPICHRSSVFMMTLP